MELLSDPNVWISFVTLVALEIVLGVDNVIFITVLAGKLPHEQQGRARTLGLALAVISRLLLLLTLSWIIGLTQPIFTVLDFHVSGRDIVLLVGGLFLMAKATQEIHQRLEGIEGHTSARVAPSMRSVLIQVMLLDVVFSLDSVITAVGMVDQVAVMMAAVVVAAGLMIVAAGSIGEFVERHPTIKMLALAFLLLIGFTLIVEALHQHIPKGYIYFAMAFSVLVEMLNLRAAASKPAPVHLREPYHEHAADNKPGKAPVPAGP